MKRRSRFYRKPMFWCLLLSHGALFLAGVLLQAELGRGLDALGGAWLSSETLGVLAGIHASGALVVASLAWLIFRARSRWGIVLGGLGSLYLLFWGTWLVSDRMTGMGINQAVLFHLFSGTSGADYSQFAVEFVIAVGFLGLACLMLGGSVYLAWRHGRQVSGHQASYSSRPANRRNAVPGLLGCLLFGLAWSVSPWHQNLLGLAHSYARLDDDETKRLQALYNTAPRTIDTQSNLVVLYLESVESTYFDQELFPGLLPRLSRLRDESAYFTGIAQAPGSGWTIAGLVNTLCGIPLATPGPDVNDMGRVERFLPRAKCLPEYLAESGFHTVYLGGASAEFAGKGRFLAQHGFDVIRDKADFQAWQSDRGDKSEVSGWGAYDDELLERTYEEFERLSAAGDPFALFALTMDTHPPHGHVSPSCSGMRYEAGHFRALNALRCADHLVSRFIERIRSSPHADDTTLVVLSDHLAMVNDAKPLIDRAEKRENLLMIFDDRLLPGERVVAGTQVDVGATLLDLLGSDESRLGFGRSLLAEASRPRNGFSKDFLAGGDVNTYLGFVRDLWDMPSVIGEIRSDGQGGVLIGDNIFDAPFFSVLDSSNRIIELYFYDFARHIDELQQGARYLYALECEHRRDAIGGVCLVSGLKGSGEKVYTPAELTHGVRAGDIL